MQSNFTEQQVKKIKETKLYQEQFAKEWGKCVIAPKMIPDELGYMCRLHIRKYSLTTLNLKFEAYKKLLHIAPQEWDISFLQIGLNYAFMICENEYYEKKTPGMKDFIAILEILVQLHDLISTMFLECEKKCVNMCALTIR